MLDMEIQTKDTKEGNTTCPHNRLYCIVDVHKEDMCTTRYWNKNKAKKGDFQ